MKEEICKVWKRERKRRMKNNNNNGREKKVCKRIIWRKIEKIENDKTEDENWRYKDRNGDDMRDKQGEIGDMKKELYYRDREKMEDEKKDKKKRKTRVEGGRF